MTAMTQLWQHWPTTILTLLGIVVLAALFGVYLGVLYERLGVDAYLTAWFRGTPPQLWAKLKARWVLFFTDPKLKKDLEDLADRAKAVADREEENMLLFMRAQEESTRNRLRAEAINRIGQKTQLAASDVYAIKPTAYINYDNPFQSLAVVITYLQQENADDQVLIANWDHDAARRYWLRRSIIELLQKVESL